jgi:HSP20 family protein
MALIRWQPRESFALQREIDSLVNNFWGDLDGRNGSNWHPKVDVVESGDAFTVEAEVPGLKKEDIQVTFWDRVLTIGGERKHEDEKTDKNYFQHERTYGKFKRSFKLGTEVDVDKISAAYQDGVLTLTLPKSEAAKPRQIEVAVS